MLWHWRGTSFAAVIPLLLVIFVSVAAFGTQPVAAGGQLHYRSNAQKSSCEQKGCQRCDLATGRCLKCRFAMLETSRVCVSYCPVGHATSIREDQLYQGTVCTPGSLLSAITGRDIAVIACAAAGGAVCVGIILGAIIYARRNAMLKPVSQDNVRKIPVPRMWKDHRASAADTVVGADERKEFLQALGGLRKDVGLLLEMLSETRTRFRGIGGPEHSMDSKVKAYRAVVRDLTRVVSLLARRDTSFNSVPADWRRLLAWAERLLARYRRTRDSKCTGCAHYQQVSDQKQEDLINHSGNCSLSAGLHTGPGATQPLFQTRQKAKEERWRKQREEAAKYMLSLENDSSSSVGDTNSSCYSDQDRSDASQEEAIMSRYCSNSYVNLSPTILEEVIKEEDPDNLDLQFEKVDPRDIEISYSKDEEALAHQRAHFTLVDENLKNDIKTSNINIDPGIHNKGAKEKGSPGMISRLFSKRLLSNSDLNIDSSVDDLHKKQKTEDVNILQDEECLASSSIYDHIESFTFDDFIPPTQKSDAKQSNLKSKTKNTANVNINRLRKPNFPGYSESFKQILDKRNLLSIHKTKIQKRLSRKGEQLNKMVRRNESRFLKDKSKLNPNMTYDRRNCKSDVVNKEVIGGDVYVTVIKQPVVERALSEHSGSYKNFNDVDVDEDEDDSQTQEVDNNNKTIIKIEDNPNTKNIRCEILTVV